MFKPYNRAQLVFDLVREIGQDGRNSQAFVSRDHQLDAEIVIKRVQKSNLVSTNGFFAESKALYASSHPNVVQIHYACEDNDYIYLAMPYYQKGAVNTLITGRFMTVREAVAAGCQVLSGLHNIHSKGLIHFDIKPDNILLSDRGEAMLSDFGLAKQAVLGLAQPDGIYTPMVAPEVLQGQQCAKTYDIYQFGLTLYRMCIGNEAFYQQVESYGKHPNFDSNRFVQDVVGGRFPNRDAFPAHIPNRLKNVIKKCLKVSPADRYTSAIDIANALAQVDGETLDWRYEFDNGKRVWNKNKGGTLTVLTVEANGQSNCTRETLATGVTRRVKAMCKAATTEREIVSFLSAP